MRRIIIWSRAAEPSGELAQALLESALDALNVCGSLQAACSYW